MKKRTSQSMREDELFMRSSYDSCGRWEIPFVKKQNVSLDDLELISCADARANDNEANKAKGVHFLWMIIVLRIFTTIQIVHSKNMHSMRSF